MICWSERKALADNDSNLSQIMGFVFNSVENIVGKGKMLFKSSLLLIAGHWNTGLYGKELNIAIVVLFSVGITKISKWCPPLVTKIWQPWWQKSQG